MSETKRDQYHVKGSHACKTPGLPQSAKGKDMEGFYTYPKIGSYLCEEDAMRVLGILNNRFPNGLFFVERTPANFDGISIPGL